MSSAHLLPAIHVGLAFLPVTLFLLALVYLDSYKLVRLRMIVQLIAAGAAAAGISFLINTSLAEIAGNGENLTIFAMPLIEEILKGIPLILLFCARRIGFMVDAAIVGFAIGTGFALVENWYYLWALQDASIGLWLVRGFGTGIMHGGSTAIVAMAAKTVSGRATASRVWILLPGLLLAYAVHALFNSFLLPPLISALTVIIVFPLLIIFVFAQSEAALRVWLGSGFDLDSQLIEAMASGEFATTPAGRYLQSLREHFEGTVLADMLCFLRLHTELALRAKGMLMMRENGFPVRRDGELDEKLSELQYLRRSIGKTGELALAPIIHSSSEDIWQIQLIEQA